MMMFRQAALAALALTALFLPLQPALAHKAPAKAATGTTWVYPVIAKFGGVHPRADADVRPDPTQNYKIFVDVVSTSHDPSRMYGSLERLARLVNLMAYAGVPADHVHIVALLDRGSGMAALTDKTYVEMMQRHGGDDTLKANPNLPVLHALKKAGVKLMVCSQAMAELGLKDSDIDPDVTITLSALTDPVVYGHKGYTFMQL